MRLHHAMEYRVEITPKMREVNHILVDRFVGMCHCLCQTGRNLVVEVPRNRCGEVIHILKETYEDVVDIRKAYLMIEDLHDFILVKPMVSEAPLLSDDHVTFPSLEKAIVDLLSDKEFANINAREKTLFVQHAFETYEINISKLIRYAGRKGKKEEVEVIISNLDRMRISTVKALQKVLDSAPVSKAWVFGSFARNEERPDSDLDILVELNATIGLFAYSALINQLEAETGRKIDLVAAGSLKSFARENVEREKVLIYERAHAGSRTA